MLRFEKWYFVFTEKYLSERCVHNNRRTKAYILQEMSFEFLENCINRNDQVITSVKPTQNTLQNEEKTFRESNPTPRQHQLLLKD